MSIMNTFRNNMKLFLYFIILGFLISMFAGVGTYLMSQKQNTAAIVNNEKIKTEDFNRILNNLIASDTSDKTPQKIQELKQQTIQILMQETLMLQETSKIGDFVAENEVRQQIAQYPLFQQNGQFSKEEYQKNLHYLIKQTPEQFEKYIQKKLIIEKGKYLIASSIKTTPNELKIETETIAADINEYTKNKQSLLLNEWFRNKAALAETKVTYETK